MSKDHPHWHLHPHLKGGHHHHPHRHIKEPPRPFRKNVKHENQGGNASPHHHYARRGTSAPPSVGTKRVKKVWRLVHGWWPDVGSLGIYNCRRISGSSRWSEHAFADAWDATRRGWPSSLGTIVDYLRSGNVTTRYHITRVIFGDSDHQNHAHIDVDPDHGGTPPCAG